MIRVFWSSLIFGAVYCSLVFATVVVLAVSFSTPHQQALVAMFAGMVFGPLVGALAGGVGIATGAVYALVPVRARDWTMAIALGLGISITANLISGWEASAETTLRQLLILAPFVGVASTISSFFAEKLLKHA